MSERDLAIRLSLKDAEIVRKALSDLGADGQRALARIEQASAPASKGLLAVNSVAGSLKGEISGLSSRLGGFGSALAALGPAGVAAGAAISAVTLGLSKGARDLAEDEVSFKRLEAVLRATGQASGVTSEEIKRLGDEMELTTLATQAAVLDAAGSLATFRSVSGDTFTRALRLSQDMAAVFGGDLRSSATQLGKALEDPIQGLAALRRVGVTFSEAQRDVIAAMVEGGRVAEAQRLILDALEGQMGGAGVGEASGLTGAADRVAKSWSNLLKAWAESTGVGRTMTDVLNGISRALQSMADADDVSVKLAERGAALAEYQAQLAELEASGRGWSVAANFARARIRDIEKEVAALRKVDDARRSSEAEAKKAAQDGAAAAERARNAETMDARLKALEAERVKNTADAAEKIRAIEKQLARDTAAAQAKSSLAGVTQADVDKEVALLRDVARQKIDAVQKPLLEAQHRAAEQTAKVLADLQREIGGVADPRTAFVDQKVASLPKTASDDDRQQAAALAGELYDLAEARKADEKAEQDRARAIERGRQFLLQHADAETVYKLQLEEIAELKRTGAVDEQTYALMVEDAEKRKLRAATDAASGMRRALQDYQKSAGDAASGAEAAVTKSFTAMEDAIVQFATTGKLSFAGFANSVIADMVRMTARQAITAPLAGAFLGMFHSGGVVGESAPMMRMVNPRVLVGAPKYHSGGLLPGERAIIAKDGERVLTQAQQDNTAATISGLAKMAGQGGGGDLRVVSNVYNYADGAEARTQVSRGADGSLRIDTIVETVEAQMSRNISRGKGLAPVMEGRYGLSAAAGAARG